VRTRGTPRTALHREAGAEAQGSRVGPGAALSREVGTGATVTCGAPGAALRQEAGAALELPRVGLLLDVSSDFFFVASYCPTKNGRVLKKCRYSSAFSLPLLLSPSSWFLLRLLQALSQCCDVQYSSTTLTIVTGFLACICTCVDFVFGIFSRASFPARHLLWLLLSL
jgi:hypothetical protein